MFGKNRGKGLFTPVGLLALALVCVGISGVFLYKQTGAVALQAPQSLDALYASATRDAMTIEEDEIFPLVSLQPAAAQTAWRDGKVLLLTINKKPQLYQDGATLQLPGEVWTVSAPELESWYARHKKGVTDWPVRLHQLVGVPLSSRYTHVTAMWVSPQDIIRPAHNTDITSGEMPLRLPENVDAAYRTWFRENILWSYFDSSYPWTRLGYTYDWAANSGEYGLTEFLVKKGATVTIAQTLPIPAYIAELEQGKPPR